MGVFCARPADSALHPDPSSIQPYVRYVRIAAALAFVGAVLILLGWALDISILKSGLSGERGTQPLTAMCFAVCGISLGLTTERCVLCSACARGAALLVLFVVIATVWQNALDVDWGLDQFLFSDAVVHEQPGPYLRPGRPAAGTLIALALLCSCLMLTRAQSTAARTVYVWLATVGALLASTVLLAYAYSLHAVYKMGFYADVGLNSGIEVAILSYGVLLRQPDLGWIRLLAGDSAGATSARRILLWTGSLLVMLAAIVRFGSAASNEGGFEVTLLTVGGLGLLLAALLSHARRLNALEMVRHGVSSDLRAAESRLLRVTQDNERQLAMLAHELRNPLTPLRNGIEIFRQISSSNPALARTTEMMARQIGQLVRLVDELVGAEPSSGVAGESVGRQSASAETPAASPESSRLRILVADDNADGADSLAMLLQAQGHFVLTARDGRRAVELAETFRPNVILMDVGMPHLDGLEAAREIRVRSWGSRVRIIALTAWGQEAERRRTHEAGMDCHLVKPVDPQALTALLRASEPSGPV